MRMRAPGPGRPGVKKAKRARGKRTLEIDGRGNSGVGSFGKFGVCRSCGKEGIVGPVEAEPTKRRCIGGCK